jgi:hypothetical protein
MASWMIFGATRIFTNIVLHYFRSDRALMYTANMVIFELNMKSIMGENENLSIVLK